MAAHAQRWVECAERSIRFVLLAVLAISLTALFGTIIWTQGVRASAVAFGLFLGELAVWVVAAAGILGFLWWLRYIVAWIVAIGAVIVAIGLVIALVWRAAQWWLSVL